MSALVEVKPSSTLMSASSNGFNGYIITSFKVNETVKVNRLRFFLAKRRNFLPSNNRIHVSVKMGDFSINDATTLWEGNVTLPALKAISDTVGGWDSGVAEDYTAIEISLPELTLLASSRFEQEPYVSNRVFISINFSQTHEDGLLFARASPFQSNLLVNIHQVPDWVGGNISTAYWINGKNMGGSGFPMVFSMWNSGGSGGQGGSGGSGGSGGQGGLPDLEEVVDDPSLVLPSLPSSLADVKRDWWKWLIVLLVLLALVGGGFYVYKKRGKKQ